MELIAGEQSWVLPERGRHRSDGGNLHGLLELRSGCRSRPVESGGAPGEERAQHRGEPWDRSEVADSNYDDGPTGPLEIRHYASNLPAITARRRGSDGVVGAYCDDCDVGLQPHCVGELVFDHVPRLGAADRDRDQLDPMLLAERDGNPSHPRVVEVLDAWCRDRGVSESHDTQGRQAGLPEGAARILVGERGQIGAVSSSQKLGGALPHHRLRDGGERRECSLQCRHRSGNDICCT